MKNKILNILLFSFLAILLGIIIGVNVYSNYMILDVQEFQTSITVMNHLGLDTNSTAIAFGGVNPGGTSKRVIFISQNATKKAKVKILKYGEFTDWIEISENNFHLNKGEGRDISFRAVVPNNAEIKDYDGKIIIIIERKLI